LTGKFLSGSFGDFGSLKIYFINIFIKFIIGKPDSAGIKGIGFNNIRACF